MRYINPQDASCGGFIPVPPANSACCPPACPPRPCPPPRPQTCCCGCGCGSQGATGPTGPTGPAVPLNALYAVNTGSQTLSSTGDPATFTTNEVEEGTAITHSPSSSDIELTEPGTYRITYSAVATNASGTGNVGLELQNDGTAIDGSESSGKVNNTSDPTPLGASVLVTVPGTATITLNATENNTTLNSAGITVQKLD